MTCNYFLIRLLTQTTLLILSSQRKQRVTKKYTWEKIRVSYTKTDSVLTSFFFPKEKKRKRWAKETETEFETDRGQRVKVNKCVRERHNERQKRERERDKKNVCDFATERDKKR